jgi:3'-phosphoadenosine 5'-phosphosulfate sulfotransferase (PAPS reductase)/FAD synthetase
LALAKYGANRVEVYYNDTGGEHPDNKRFLADCQRWFGIEVRILKSSKYSNHFDVLESRRFLGSQNGAPCTSELKRLPSESIWEFGDVEIFGFSASERARIEKWRNNNPERIIECPLVDMQLTSIDCIGILGEAGIEIPEMYKLGFKHNNCLGCVKAQSVNYWKRIRLNFPDVFERMAKLEREVGFAINRVQRNGKRRVVYLDEFDSSGPQGEDSTVECGLFCMAAINELETGKPADKEGAT